MGQDPTPPSTTRPPVNRPTFSQAQEMALRLRWAANGEAACPMCGVPLEDRPVPQPSQVSYVRRRSWLTCPECRRTLVADDPKGRGEAPDATPD